MKLKELRKDNKCTQEDVARVINTTQQTYARYELETSEPTIDTLCKLADYYKVSLDYLVGRNFNNEFGYLSEDEKTLIKTYRLMNEDNKLRYLAQGQGIMIAQN